MLIKKIKVKNYRNLDNTEIFFDSKINYIVGDNNTGKSNLLKLFDKLFNNAFLEEDYYNLNKKIIIELTIMLDENENSLYHFNLDNNETSLIISQGIYESIPLMVDKNKKKYDYKLLKKVFYKVVGNKIDSKILMNQSIVDILIKNDIDNLSIFNIKDSYQENNLYLTYASLLIYNQIYHLFHNNYEGFNNLIYTKDSKRILPIMIALDEPELHLNAYLQRTLINYYKKLLNNENEIFNNILKSEFNIDLLSSTLFVVTHSSEALVDDYKSIIRLYKKNDSVGVASGSILNLKPNISKHLTMNFSDLKEAFFCKKVIIVEGITEFGCLGMFAEKLGYPLDNYGICLINAQGEGSISKIRTLLNAFKIESYAIYDGDVKKFKKESKYDFFTDNVCFEMEIVSKLVNTSSFNLLEEIAYSISGAKNQVFDEIFTKRTFEKLEFDPSEFKSCRLKDVKRDDLELYKAIYFTWFYKKKGLYLGRIIGKMLPKELIPDCYKNAIYESVKND